MFNWTTLLLAYLWIMGGLGCVRACEAHAGVRFTRSGRFLGVLLWPVLTLISIAVYMIRELVTAWTGARTERGSEHRHVA